MIRLSVNVNKVATLRNSRGGRVPSVLDAVRTIVEAGAPGITVHPRADARHVTTQDVLDVAAALQPLRGRVEYNIEGDIRPGLMELVHQVKPDQCTLVPVTLASPVAAPVYAIVPPARPGNAPALVAEVPAPEPAESPERYGPAQWMKTFKTQLRREVGLDELLGDNPMIPQDRGQIEVEWELVQDTPNVEGKQKRNGALRQGTLDGDTRAVVRRFEIYDYTGAYDPVTNQALCADLTCTAPSAGELGDFVSAQMTAANVRVPSLTVTKVGSGDVSSSDRSISCGSKCSAFESDGALIVLTASANSGSAFRRWTGACDGPDPICRVGINEHADVAATFAQIFNLSVSKSKSGSVSADQAGVEQTLNCGGTCSVKYAAGSVVTLTAVPAPGKQFVNWSGGPCDKSAVAVCTVLITRDTSIQPNFTK